MVSIKLKEPTTVNNIIISFAYMPLRFEVLLDKGNENFFSLHREQSNGKNYLDLRFTHTQI